MVKTKPALRFAGFTDDWGKRKLGEIAEIVSGGTPSTAISSYWEGEIDWYAPAEIADQIYAYSSQKKITAEGYNNCSAKMLPIGTVLFTSRAGIGKTVILAREGCTNQGFQSIVPHKDALDSYFIFSRTEELKAYGETTGAGSTFVEVSGKQMAAMELMMPSTMDEQKSIGVFFAKLDHLITLHQHKLEKLRSVKQFFLQSMFPQKGRSVPAIRFAGFTDAWEQRKLGELADFSKGQGYTKSDLKKTGTPIILYGRLYTKYQTIIREVDTFADVINGAVFSKGGEVILPSSGETAEDIAIASNVDKSGILLGGGLNIVTPHKELLPIFLAIELSFAEPHNALAKRAQGKTVVHLYNEDLKDVSILFPIEEEQSLIGSFFEQIDHLITLHLRKLEKLRSIKQFCLQNMFV